WLGEGGARGGGNPRDQEGGGRFSRRGWPRMEEGERKSRAPVRAVPPPASGVCSFRVSRENSQDWGHQPRWSRARGGGGRAAVRAGRGEVIAAPAGHSEGATGDAAAAEETLQHEARRGPAGGEHAPHVVPQGPQAPRGPGPA